MKKQLRAQGITELKEFESNQGALKKKVEKELYDLFYQSNFWQEAKFIGITKSMAFEVNTDPIINRAFQEGKRVAVPCVSENRQLEFIEITPMTRFVVSSFGIAEPVDGESKSIESIDHLIVPGVVYRPDGYRIGFGGGYYDRLLAAYEGATASLLFDFQLAEDWQPDSFDKSVDQLFFIKSQRYEEN